MTKQEKWENTAKELAMVIAMEYIPLLKNVADDCDDAVSEGDITALSHQMATKKRHKQLSIRVKEILED